MEREAKGHITNETLGGKFKSQFKLVNYAIKLAENMIHSGRAPRIKRIDIQNPAAIILEELIQGKDQLDVIEEIKVEQTEVYRKEEKEPNNYKPERKKIRKLL